MIELPTNIIEQMLKIKYDRKKGLVIGLACYGSDDADAREFMRDDLRGFLYKLEVTLEDCKKAFGDSND
jgi:hypothetical protein